MGNTGGWNRSTANQPTVKKDGAKAPSKVKGIVAGLVTVCVLGGLCLWMFSGGDDAPKVQPDKGRGRIKEVTPAVVRKTEKVVSAEKPIQKAEVPSVPVGNVITAKGARAGRVIRLMDGSVVTNTTPVIFQRDFERSLMVALRPGGIGGTLLPSVRADYNDEQILQMLKEMTIPEENDPPAVKRIKNEVQALKEQILLEVGKGRSVSDVLDEIQQTKSLDHMVNVQTMKMQSKAILEGDEEGIQKVTSSANALREKRGLQPLALPDELRQSKEKSEQLEEQEDNQ